MARGTWTIQVLGSSGTYYADGSMYVTNADIEEKSFSTQQKIVLADGSKAFVGFEHKTQYEPVDFFWADMDSSFITKLETYLGNNDTLKITTAQGTVFTGHFITYQKTWVVGTSPVMYDIIASFERTT
jgi:hypothetical protein